MSPEQESAVAERLRALVDEEMARETREVALNAAARSMSGCAYIWTSKDVIERARKFEAYLKGDRK